MKFWLEVNDKNFVFSSNYDEIIPGLSTKCNISISCHPGPSSHHADGRWVWFANGWSLFLLRNEFCLWSVSVLSGHQWPHLDLWHNWRLWLAQAASCDLITGHLSLSVNILHRIQDQGSDNSYQHNQQTQHTKRDALSLDATSLSTRVYSRFNNAFCFNERITFLSRLLSFLQWTTFELNPQFFATRSHSVPGLRPLTSSRNAFSSTLFSSFLWFTSSLYLL